MSKGLKHELEKELSHWLNDRDTLDVKIKNLQVKRKLTEEKINNLNKAYVAATGKSYKGIGELRSAADLAEDLLKEFGELHVDKMLELISERQLLGAGQTLKKQSLVATLVKHVQQNKRFRRVPNRTNTFALIEGVKTKEE